MGSINENITSGESVGAVLTNTKTGVKTVIGGARPEPKYLIEIKVTNLQTGEVYKHEETRK